MTLQLINPSSQTFLAGITIAREELVPKAHPGHDAKKVKTKAKTEREHHDCPITSGFLMRLRRKEYEVRPLTLSNVDRILLETRRFFILLPRQFPGTLFYTLLIINTRIINSLVVQSFGSTGSLVVNTYRTKFRVIWSKQDNLSTMSPAPRYCFSRGGGGCSGIERHGHTPCLYAQGSIDVFFI